VADDNVPIAASADASVANANFPNISAMHQLAPIVPQLRFSASSNFGHHWVLSTTLVLATLKWSSVANASLPIILADAKVYANLYIV